MRSVRPTNQVIRLMGKSIAPLRRLSHLDLIAIVASLGQDTLREQVVLAEVGKVGYVVIGIHVV
jgi:hypothetical protein